MVFSENRDPLFRTMLSVTSRELARQFARDRAVIDLLHVVDPGEDHGGVELAAQDADRLRHAPLNSAAIGGVLFFSPSVAPVGIVGVSGPPAREGIPGGPPRLSAGELD